MSLWRGTEAIAPQSVFAYASRRAKKAPRPAESSNVCRCIRPVCFKAGSSAKTSEKS